ncbi:zf-HC2 domain-containing protein [Kutzneria kofuensis]|uniref:RNA polymerase sigma-70 factor (ECF subfamily) n=1 Tax=Kutzneria kofuensis TaxID=103725 RepID=A0A7W9KG62_9PSEU|nr:zf-HC2 domain-containing protein [Kutzneria kofuensis]MBB5891837.1 RNA polymerase sigma-70 factor (ECF subfamily) [Kutzneria kofuensis]
MKNPDVERYLAGTLDEERSRLLERHLRTCVQCSDDVAEFHEFQRIVDTVLNGPPPDGDLVLQRALRQIRAESAAKRRRRGAFLASAAAVVVGVALTGGVAVGRSGDSVGPVRASATDTGTGAGLSVSFAETSGWSHISAAVSGVPVGERCELVLVGKDGRRTVAAGWKVTAAQSTIDASALMDPADIASVRLESTAGKQFVSVKL